MLRPRHLFVSCVVAILAAASGTAQQVSVWLTQPPPNQLKIADLWKVDVTNNTGGTLRVYLHGTAEELSIPDGIIADATTTVVDLPPGRIRYTGRELQPVDVDDYNPRYYEALLTTGNVPSGEYLICVEVIDDNTGALLARDCKTVIVTRASVPILISPPDVSEVPDRYPVFTWMPSVPPRGGEQFLYKLRVAEMFGRQTPQDAIDRNPAWFELDNLPRTIVQYPISMRGMEVGRNYAWMVEAFEVRGSQRIDLGESEVWQFTYQPLEAQDDDDAAEGGSGGAGTVLTDSTCPGDNWDFELGTLACWEVTGGAFADDPVEEQHPVLGSNGHHASWWASSYGFFDGDKALGSLLSVPFEIANNTVSFLFGGLSDRESGVELLVEKGAKDTFSLPLRTLPGSDKEWYLAHSTSATDEAGGSERLVPVEWDVTDFLNRTAYILIRDSSLVGHVNVDHFQFYDKEEKDSIKLPVLVMAAGENHSLAATPDDTPDLSIVDKLRGDVSNIRGGKKTIAGVNVVNRTSPTLKAKASSAARTVTFKSDDDDDDNGSPLPDVGRMTVNPAIANMQVNSNLVALLAKVPNVVWGWGDNADKAVGPSMPSVVKEPRKINGLVNVQAMDAGPWNSLAVGNDGMMWGWGENEHAQLGIGDRKSTATPKKNTYVQSMGQVATGAFHSLALTAKGELMVWGWNHVHAIGLTNEVYTNVQTKQVDSLVFLYRPYPMEGITNVVDVEAGEAHSVILKVNGTVYATGLNDRGQTGQPIDEPITEHFTKVQTGRGPAASSTKRSLSTPKRASTGPTANGIVAIAAGFDHTLALSDNGNVLAWGGNASGQLGNGKTEDSPTPVTVQNLTGVCAIAAGDGFSMALDTNGRVFAWGNNVLGQLGDGTRVGKWEPVQVATLDAVQGIVAGGSHAMAVRADGGLWTWGTNDYGQLGEGPVTNLLPVPLEPPTPPMRVNRLAENKE